MTKAQQRGDLAPAHASQLRQAGIFRVPSFTDELVLVRTDGGPLRSKPAVVEKIIQIKGHRYVPAPPCPCAQIMLTAPL